jgi:hypothetical protein
VAAYKEPVGVAVRVERAFTLGSAHSENILICLGDSFFGNRKV